ncbi:MAG TPA: TIGR03086 family protein [Actinomycetales bacterium]|nr:TIGR03086 family protein [Actinomycetales bacterium]
MTTHDQLVPVLRSLSRLVGTIAPDDSGPTPCTEFTVSELRGHVVRWMSAFAAGLEDPDGVCPTDDVAVAGDGAAQVAALADRIDAALASPPESLSIDGAAMPTAMALPMILAEYLVHGWDLAVSTGGRWDPDPAAVEASIVFMDSMLGPDYQGEGKDFGPRVAVAHDAPALDRLVGLTGRDPGWTPNGA